MKTVLIKAEVLEIRGSAVCVKLDDGFGDSVRWVAEDKTISIDRLEGKRKPDHLRSRRKVR